MHLFTRSNVSFSIRNILSEHFLHLLSLSIQNFRITVALNRPLSVLHRIACHILTLRCSTKLYTKPGILKTFRVLIELRQANLRVINLIILRRYTKHILANISLFLQKVKVTSEIHTQIHQLNMSLRLISFRIISHEHESDGEVQLSGTAFGSHVKTVIAAKVLPLIT